MVKNFIYFGSDKSENPNAKPFFREAIAVEYSAVLAINPVKRPGKSCTDLILSRTLCFVEHPVRLRNQGTGIAFWGGRHGCHAQAYGNMLFQAYLLGFDCMTYFFGNVKCALRIGIRKNHGKFFPAVSCGDIVCTE